MDIIVATYETGNVLGVLDCYDIEFDVGNGQYDNTWEATVPPSVIKELPENARIYIPGTEFGGLYRRKGIDYASGNPTIGGITWRGMLQKRLKASYASMSGKDIAAALSLTIGTFYTKPNATLAVYNLIQVKQTDVGVYSTWTGGNYLTFLDALQAVLNGTVYRLNIGYEQGMSSSANSFASVGCSKIQTWNEGMYADFKARCDLEIDTDHVNHLICRGEGTLSSRTIKHLYTDEAGEIYTTQQLTGALEVAETFDYTSADADMLDYYGRRRLKERVNKSKHFTIKVDTSRLDVAVDDLVQVYDDTTGITLQAPVTGKTVKFTGDTVSRVEYTLSNEVSIW